MPTIADDFVAEQLGVEGLHPQRLEPREDTA